MEDIVKMMLAQRVEDERRYEKQREEDEVRHKQTIQLIQQQVTLLAVQNNEARAAQEANFRAASELERVPHPAILIQALGANISEYHHGSDGADSFASWYERHKFVFDSEGLKDVDKVGLLLSRLSRNDRDKYSRDILPDIPTGKSFAESLIILNSLFGQCESQFFVRQKSLEVMKSELDDFATYAGRVKKMVFDFKIRDCTDEQFRCLLFVHGLKAPKDLQLRQKLITELDKGEPTTLDALTGMCKRAESARLEMAKEPFVRPTEVQAVQEGYKEPKKLWDNKNRAEIKPKFGCLRCGRFHWIKDCPFIKLKCFECSQEGHKKGFCGWEKRTKANRRQSFAVTVCSLGEANRKFVKILLNGRRVKLQLDTASDITIISAATWHAVGAPTLTKTKVNPQSATKTPLKLLGEMVVELVLNGISKKAVIYVTNHNLNLLGINTIEQFGLWDKPFNAICNKVTMELKSLMEELKREFTEVFSKTLGRCKKTLVKLELKPNAVPVFRPKRKPAISALAKIEEELLRLQNTGIITPVDFSDWAAPIVVARKPNGRIRICGDYSSGLNEVIEGHSYPLPLPSDLFDKCAGSKFFSTIDLAEAYFQCEVDDESKAMMTINTHKGLFKVNRLQAGIKSAPGCFQQIMDNMLAGFEGAAAYLDDIVVFGRDKMSHENNLREVFRRISEYGFTVNEDKCTFLREEISFLGRIVSKDGTRPDPESIRAVINMAAPTNIQQLRAYLGAVAYYGHYLPGIRELRAPMDELLKKEVPWNWNLKCQTVFNKFKTALADITQLVHYDPTQVVTVAADASNSGVGACLYHTYADGSRRPIAHAARALLPAEVNYSQVEKEGLALIFGVKKFHRYIYGRKFVLETDHKPLLSIFGSKKGIPAYTANRLQRWALLLTSYEFEVCYTNTNAFGHADVLSRLMGGVERNEEEDYIVACVQCDEEVLDEGLQNLPVRYDAIRRATDKCKDLQRVVECLRTKWPPNPEVTKSESNPFNCFYRRKDDLLEIKGIIFFGERVVIPGPFRRKVLEQLHEGHPGISRMTQLARAYAYWPGIDGQIKEFVQGCSKCASCARLPIKTTLESWPIPSRPWQRIHIDYAGPQGGMWYLVIVDAYSKWLEVFETSSTTTSSTVACLRRTFARYGIPEQVVSDNGVQFTSDEFARFCKLNGVEHLRTAPYHPQSNGQAERFVDILKRGLKKIKGEATVSEDLQTFLRTYRTTPSATTPNGKSPADEFFGRHIRTSLDLLRPPVEETRQTNSKQNDQFNVKHGAKHREFQVGDKVMALCHRGNSTFWASGIVTGRRGKLRMRFGQPESGLTELYEALDLQPPPLPEVVVVPLEESYQRNEASRNQGPVSEVEAETETDTEQANSNQQERSPTWRTRSGRAVRLPLRYQHI